MKDVITYKDFIGSVHFSAEDSIFYGKIEGIEDLVTFEGNDVEGINIAFQEAVEDYIQLCKDNNKAIFKSYKGSFNVRVSPSLHQKAALLAKEAKVSLNNFVAEAIRLRVQES